MAWGRRNNRQDNDDPPARDSRCSTCGLIVGTPPGRPAPTHTSPGNDNEKCSGSGDYTNPR